MKKIGYILMPFILLLASMYLFLPVLSIKFLHFPIILAVLSLIMFLIFMGKDLEQAEAYKKLNWTQKTSGYLFLGLCVYIIIAIIGSSPILTWRTKHDLLNLVEITDFDQSVPNVDMSNLIILDAEDALRTSERLITETNPSLGSQFKIGEGTLTVIDERPFWIFPLEYRGVFKWLSTRGEIPGYLKVSATRFNDAEFVDYTYSVCTSGYFGDDLKRLIYSKFPTYGLTDFSFEVNDEGEGMWVVTAYTHRTWISTPDAVGTIIVNPVTREMQFYDFNAQPAWVNRVIPLKHFDKQLSWYGKYTEGWWNPSDRGKLKDTDGKGYVFKDGELYFYTGLTSVGKDSATTGFVIFNPRTGEAEYNRISGTIEQRAIGLMEELVQNAGYQANYPYLININGEPTYFSTLKGNSGNVVGYAFASVQNYKAVAWGQSLREAQTEYNRSLVREGSNNILAEHMASLEVAKGTVSRLGQLKDAYYVLKLVGDPRVFIINSDQFSMVALTEVDDQVEIQFISTSEVDRIDAVNFVNRSIK